MSEKRRDNRNRILHNGESQRQDGRYAYKYKDINGETKFVYSWRLDKNDRAPAGKPRDLSLREKERQIQQDLFNQIVPNGGNLTVLELVQKYLSLKVNVRHNTQANYNFVVGILKKEAFGSLRIDKVKLSDAKAWLIKLQKDGRGYSTIHSVRGVVRPAFEMAVQDDLIRKNPFGFELATVVVNDSVTREAITRAQERAFLKFIQEDNCYRKYYDGIYILFHTGLRISEFCGLTISDIDFQNKRIRVDHQLQRKRDMEYIIEDTKTKSGERYVPMSQQVVECFRRVIANRKPPKQEPIIDGYTGFLFLDKNGKPCVAMHIEHHMQWAMKKYRKLHPNDPLPTITPHVLRHTFCTDMANAGMDIKDLQYLMGHSDAEVTLNVYTHASYAHAESAMQKILQFQPDNPAQKLG